MIYYYAFTGHKNGLDRVKKAAAILNKLREHNLDTMLLVNDFRAGLMAREFGVPYSVTIETIQDIDAIAERGDSVLIDSPEDDHGRLVKYCADFKNVFRFATHDEDKSIHGEMMLTLDCHEADCFPSLIVDDFYFEEHKKEERTLFFLGDSDADKLILNHSDFFKDSGMELLLGHYFYVKYEDDLAKIFDVLHEPEEYMELIRSSSRVVTASFQTALEATVSGAEVIFMDLNKISMKEKKILTELDVTFIALFDKNAYQNIAIEAMSEKHTSPNMIVKKADTLVEKLVTELQKRD